MGRGPRSFEALIDEEIKKIEGDRRTYERDNLDILIGIKTRSGDQAMNDFLNQVGPAIAAAEQRMAGEIEGLRRAKAMVHGVDRGRWEEEYQ